MPFLNTYLTFPAQINPVLRDEVFTVLRTVSGQQQHFFDSRLTYHASRSAMGVAMGAGYPLTQNWGYNNYSSYLGYNTGAAGLSSYQTPLTSYTSPLLDPHLTGTSLITTPMSPRGKYTSTVYNSTY